MSMENLSPELENDLLLNGRKKNHLFVEGKHLDKSIWNPNAQI